MGSRSRIHLLLQYESGLCGAACGTTSDACEGRKQTCCTARSNQQAPSRGRQGQDPRRRDVFACAGEHPRRSGIEASLTAQGQGARRGCCARSTERYSSCSSRCETAHRRGSQARREVKEKGRRSVHHHICTKSCADSFCIARARKRSPMRREMYTICIARTDLYST